MAWLSDLIGEKVIHGEGEEAESSRFEGCGKVLGIYFSAHWCPPCRAFTPQLVQWYKKFKAGPNGEKLDLVFVSSDRDEGSFKEYFTEMPWFAVPYAARDKKATLSKKFKVSGIPTLVFVNGANGQLITSDGRSIVVDDTEGNDFPWTPKPVVELLSGKVKTKTGETTWAEVKEKVDVIGIYFSAHWCGPCRAFTPQLVKTYNTLKDAGKKFEIIFCSSDRDQDAFQEYHDTMPWYALPFGDPRKKSLSRFFDVSGIPALVILDKDGKTINASGRAAISADPEGKEFPWKPKRVNKLTGMTASDINDSPFIVWFTDGKKESMSAAEDALLAAAEHYEKVTTDPEVLFFYTDADDEDDLTSSLRSFANLPPKKTPLLALIDIPAQKQYTCEADVVVQKDVQDLLEGYEKNTIEGKSLRAK